MAIASFKWTDLFNPMRPQQVTADYARQNVGGTAGSVLHNTVDPSGFLGNELRSRGQNDAANILDPQSPGAREPEAAASSGGGYYGGGVGGGLEAVQSGQSISDIIASLLQYNPQLAAQNWDIASQYTPQYAAMLRGLASQERAGNMQDVLSLAPEMEKIRQATDRPEITNLRNMLLKQVTDELGMGSKLTAEQNANVNEQFRSAEVARGFGMGSGSGNRESVQKALEGMKLLENRQGKASALISQEKATQTDPFQVVLGTPATSTNNALQASTAPTMNLLSFLGQNYWNSANNALNVNAQNQAQQRYNTTLMMTQNSPLLKG